MCPPASAVGMLLEIERPPPAAWIKKVHTTSVLQRFPDRGIELWRLAIGYDENPADESRFEWSEVLRCVEVLDQTAKEDVIAS